MSKPVYFNHPCGALKERDGGIWGGKLHLPIPDALGRITPDSGEGFVQVILVVNPKAGKPNEPQLFIRHESAGVTLGALWRLPSGLYRGQINTYTPLMLRANFADNAADGVRRFVIRHISGTGNTPRYPVTLQLTPSGEMFKHRVA